jgi:hypothetical protein
MQEEIKRPPSERSPLHIIMQEFLQNDPSLTVDPLYRFLFAQVRQWCVV